MQTQQISPIRRLPFTVLLTGVLAVTGCTVTTGAPMDRDRADQAWSDRLSGQAEAESPQRQVDAQLERANDAYAQRLIGQARAHGAQQARERANQAWSDRLNGLARSLEADR